LVSRIRNRPERSGVAGMSERNKLQSAAGQATEGE